MDSHPPTQIIIYGTREEDVSATSFLLREMVLHTAPTRNPLQIDTFFHGCAGAEEAIKSSLGLYWLRIPPLLNLLLHFYANLFHN